MQHFKQFSLTYGFVAFENGENAHLCMFSMPLMVMRPHHEPDSPVKKRS